MRPALALLVAALAVAACTPPAPDLFMPSTDALCGAEALDVHVGQSVDVLASQSLPDGTRIIRPGMAVTMDYWPDRLNVELDAEDRILRTYCG